MAASVSAGVHPSAVEAEVGNKEDAGVWPAELESRAPCRKSSLVTQQAQRDVYAAWPYQEGGLVCIFKLR